MYRLSIFKYLSISFHGLSRARKNTKSASTNNAHVFIHRSKKKQSIAEKIENHMPVFSVYFYISIWFGCWLREEQ